MTDEVELEAEVAVRLGPVITPNLTSADRACDLYDAYVLTLVLRGIHQPEINRKPAFRTPIAHRVSPEA